MADAARARTVDEVVRNAAVGRQLPRLAAESGFTVPSAVPATSVFRDVRVADQILGLARGAPSPPATSPRTRRNAGWRTSPKGPSSRP
ncbi:hypothetical protein ACH4YO_38150 [Streptomyces noursei]|uniref:hypothetical protein n=1 Tax=Streptomyces noursei TaxID=1971 RepID=UPI00379A550F